MKKNTLLFILITFCCLTAISKHADAQNYEAEVKKMFDTKEDIDIIVEKGGSVKEFDEYSYYLENDSLYYKVNFGRRFVRRFVSAIADFDFSKCKVSQSYDKKPEETQCWIKPVYYKENKIGENKGLFSITSGNKRDWEGISVYIYFPNKGMADQGLIYLKEYAENAKNKTSGHALKTTLKATAISESKSPSAQSFGSIVKGKQTWMDRNLDLKTFSNGDSIPEAKSKGEWEKAGAEKKAAWCYYEFNSANGDKYGKLYNWYAVADPRGLAPKGWHVPSKDEFDILIEVPSSNSGKKLKSTTDWKESKEVDEDWELTGKVYGNGDNSSGFNALPGGSCGEYGNCDSQHLRGYWWSTSEKYTSEAHCLFIQNSIDMAMVISGKKYQGYSVRCIKD